MHPQYQQQAFEEIREILPDQNSHVTVEDIAKLSFSSRFIKEVMRVFTCVPFMPRKVNEDIFIGKYLYINLFDLTMISTYYFDKFRIRLISERNNIDCSCTQCTSK